MKIIEKKNQVIIQGVENFNLEHIFECGQCFRWEKENDGSYTGVVYDKVINTSFKEGNFIISNATIDDYNEIWKDYFDLDRDYGLIKDIIKIDDIMTKATEFGWGIRILKQQLWETLLSFIISSNNLIPRIKKIIKSICEEYGQPIRFNEKIYYTFPKAEDLYLKTIEDLAFCRSGYRCEYLIESSRMIIEDTSFLDRIALLNTVDARKELMRIKGVGPKVADCVLLFGGQKFGIFPTDVWVKRVMEYFYLGENSSFKDIQLFSDEKFANYAGFAQQYLFYYAREQKIGK